MDNRFDAYRAKIFLTGDSITEGDGNASAYRYALFKKLWEAGAAFTFLGPNTSGDLRLPTAYYPHGGYCGITIGSDPEKDPGLMGRVKTMEITALMRTQRYEQARELLEGKIVLTDVREGEVQLTNMWFELMARIEKGDASEESIAWARETLKPPKHLDFRMN